MSAQAKVVAENDPASAEPTLFGSEFPVLRKTTAATIRPTPERSLALTTSVQYTFSFLKDMLNSEFTNVVGFVPKSRSIALSYFAFDFFSHLGKDVQWACRRLQKHGYFFLGDVISLSEEEIVASGVASQELVVKMSETLASIDLRFGSRTPLWRVRATEALAPRR